MSDLSIFDEGAPPPCPQPFNMADYVLAAGRACPDKTALEILSGSAAEIWTYRALTDAVLATAGGLQAMGLAQGSLILLRVGNTVDFPILFLGAIAAGYVPIPTSSQLTEPETRALISDLNPALVAFGAGVAVIGNLKQHHLLPADIAALRQHAPGQIAFGDPNRLAYIVTTSGTSGKPRAVEHAHRAVWARRMMWQGWYGLTRDDRMLHAGAFNWTFTLGTGLMDPWAMGATALILSGEVATQEIPDILTAHKATIFAAAPGVYRQILKSGQPLHLPDLRHALSAGEKLPATIRNLWHTATGTEVFEALGMSEVSTFISAAPSHPTPPGTSGRPQIGRRVAVLDPITHAPVAPQTPGVLAVSNRDPGLMLGYRNAPAETSEKFSGEWFLTGDTVVMDRDHNVTYLGRSDDMMNAGGYRVSPIEVETVLNAHPHIHESAAAAIEVKPDTFVIAGFYQSDIDLDASELADWCSARLARYKCPRLFYRLDELPKGANNKLRRGDLRAGRKGVE